MIPYFWHTGCATLCGTCTASGSWALGSKLRGSCSNAESNASNRNFTGISTSTDLSRLRSQIGQVRTQYNVVSMSMFKALRIFRRWLKPRAFGFTAKSDTPVAPFPLDKKKVRLILFCGLLLQNLSDGLEESKNKVVIKLPVGSSIIANNYFWLHGRKPFKENKSLSRELLRIRGRNFSK